jgi:hypothetical protein
MEHDSNSPHPTPASAAFEANLDLYVGDAPARRDGWTPAARRLFLEVVAKTGIVTRACAYAGMSRDSAYALRYRDPLFAAGWDAADLLARDPLADGIREQAAEGITETITRDGEVVATRHRFDGRLSMAVLHRLDKRCDRAAELGGPHLALVRHWDEWLTLVGNGEEQAALALLQSAPHEFAPPESPPRTTAQHCQFRKLPESENPTADLPDRHETDDSDRCWKNGEGVWLTHFPPPPGFDGYESCKWDGLTWYERACTAEEAALLDADHAADEAEQRAEAERERAEIEEERDAWFAALRAKLASPGLDRGSPFPPTALE